MSKAFESVHFMERTGQRALLSDNMVSEVYKMLRRDITLEEAKALFEAADFCANPKESLKEVRTSPFALKLDLDRVEADDLKEVFENMKKQRLICALLIKS